MVDREMESGWDPSKIDAKVASVLVPEPRARNADEMPMIYDLAFGGAYPRRQIPHYPYPRERPATGEFLPWLTKHPPAFPPGSTCLYAYALPPRAPSRELAPRHTSG